MKISIEHGSGFCFGVTRVIEMAEEILEKEGMLYCLGEIVHNEKEVNRLRERGIRFIEAEDLKELKSLLLQARKFANKGISFVAEFIEIDKQVHVFLAKISQNPVFLSLQQLVHDNIDSIMRNISKWNKTNLRKTSLIFQIS